MASWSILWGEESISKWRCCIDLALSAQVRSQMHKPQRGSSFSEPCEGVGGCASRSSPQSLGRHAAGFQSDGDARILVLERADHPLDHAVLLRAVGSDELLLQPIVFDQRRVAVAGKNQAIVGPQQERMFDLAQAPVSSNQRLLQGRLRCLGSATAAQVPTLQLSTVAVNHQGRRGPTNHRAPSNPGTDRSPCVGQGPWPQMAKPGFLV